MRPALGAGLRPVRTKLPNGAVVTVQETAVTPAVTIHARFYAGSLYEPDELTGLAYMTGRVIDRGTERRSGEVIAEELDDRGVSLAVSTTRHTMALSCTCLSQDFDEVLGIVVDIARRPTFPEVQIARRRAEAITALRQDEDNPGVRAVETLFELLYGARHPYARPAKGTIATIERIDRAAISGFHARHVRPDVLSLVIVGAVDGNHARARAAAEIEGWTAPPAAAVMVPPPAVSPGRRRRDLAMPGKPQSDIAYGFTTITRRDPRYYAYWMMNNILGQFGLGGRLADNIRERQGMAYYTYSAFDPSMGEGPLLIRAGVDPDNVERALEAIDEEVRQLGAHGPTEGEVSETRQYLIGSIPRMLETNDSIASFLQIAEQFALGLDYDRRLPSLLQAVTLEEIRAAAADVLIPERAVIAVAGPSV